MKTFLKIAILALITHSIIGCNNTPSGNSFELPNQENIEYSTIYNDIATRYVLGLYIKDSHLIIRGNNQENLFFVHDKNTGNKIQDFCAIGRGPFEAVSPIYFEYTKDSSLITDSNFKKAMFFNTKDMIAGKANFYREKAYPFPEYRTQLMTKILIHLRDNKYLVSGPFLGDNRFYIISNPLRDDYMIEGIYNEYPKIIDTTENNIENRLIANYNSNIALSPDKSKMVYLSGIGAFGEVFDINGNTINRSIFKCLSKPENYDVIKDKFINPQIGAITIGFGDIITTDNYIYAIYYNEKYETAGNNNNTIMVFDWELNPIKQLKGESSIIKFTKDDQTGNIYGIIINKETFGLDIIKFNEKFD